MARMAAQRKNPFAANWARHFSIPGNRPVGVPAASQVTGHCRVIVFSLLSRGNVRGGPAVVGAGRPGGPGTRWRQPASGISSVVRRRSNQRTQSGVSLDETSTPTFIDLEFILAKFEPRGAMEMINRLDFEIDQGSHCWRWFASVDNSNGASLASARSTPRATAPRCVGTASPPRFRCHRPLAPARHLWSRRRRALTC